MVGCNGVKEMDKELKRYYQKSVFEAIFTIIWIIISGGISIAGENAKMTNPEGWAMLIVLLTVGWILLHRYTDDWGKSSSDSDENE